MTEPAIRERAARGSGGRSRATGASTPPVVAQPGSDARVANVSHFPDAASLLAQEVARVIGDRLPPHVRERVLAELESLPPEAPDTTALKRLLETGSVTGSLLGWPSAPTLLLGMRSVDPASLSDRLGHLADVMQVHFVNCQLAETVWLLARQESRPVLTKILADGGLPSFLAVETQLSALETAPGHRAALAQLLHAGFIAGRRGHITSRSGHADMRIRLLVDVMAQQPALLRGPLDALLDQPEHAGFLATLRTWLACNRDIPLAARELHLHTNTVRYRLKRAQELSGVDFDDWNQRLLAELQLKLRHELLTQPVTAT